MDKEYEKYHRFTRERTRGGYKYSVTFTAVNQVLKNGHFVDGYLVEVDHKDTGQFAFSLAQDVDGSLHLEKSTVSRVIWLLEPNEEFLNWCRLQINRRFVS